MKSQKVWLVCVLALVAVSLIWWLRSKPTAKVVSVGTMTFPKPIEYLEHRVQRRIFIVTEDNRGWQLTIQEGKLVRKPAQVPAKVNCPEEVRSGFFDMDEDGYPEFFKVERADPVVLWVFKRRESVKKQTVKHQPLPSWFKLPDRSRWVVWARIPWKRKTEYDGYDATFTFVTDSDPKQPRKVVVWVEQHCAGGFGSLFALSHDGQRLIPSEQFEQSLYGVDALEDFDSDGVKEIIAVGSSVSHLSDYIFKWDGRTYRLWWFSPQKDEYALWTKICDLEGDGVMEGVSVLSLQKDRRKRILAVYRFERGGYRKVAQYPLPKEDREEYPRSLGILSTKKGGVIALGRKRQALFFLYKRNQLRWLRLSTIEVEFHPFRSYVLAEGDGQATDIFFYADIWWRPKWLDKIAPFLPSPVQDWALNFGRDRSKVFVLSFDGERIHVRQVWRGRLREVGKVGNKIWALISSELSVKNPFHRYRLLFGSNGRYKVIWQKDFPSLTQTCAADLDGDGDDELIFSSGRKVRVFKIVPH
ncbi:MAG: VCBS repeat-containing protein [Armatimonadota bacterium]|nr:VCBS repeat-containing protein [Armatimonadota bacterium]